ASGTVGIYERSGAVRQDVVEALATAVGPDCVVFEAPREDQQAWFVRRFGPDVNLANVPPDGALGLATFRLSLRADTYGAWTRGRVRARRCARGWPLCPWAGSDHVNLAPAQYREVSVAEVPVPLDPGALRAYLTGRPVYRRTRYLIARNGPASMVAEVSKE